MLGLFLLRDVDFVVFVLLLPFPETMQELRYVLLGAVPGPRVVLHDGVNG